MPARLMVRRDTVAEMRNSARLPPTAALTSSTYENAAQLFFRLRGIIFAKHTNMLKILMVLTAADSRVRARGASAANAISRAVDYFIRYER